MPQEREAQSNLAAFYKFTSIGQAVAGLVQSSGENDNGVFITLRPVLTRSGRAASWEKGEQTAVGLTTDLSMKINPQSDVGRFLLIEYVDTEPSSRGQPKKLFRVVELSQGEIIGLRDGTFTLPDAQPRKRADQAAQTQDDLPF